MSHIVASRQHAPDPVTFTSAAANQIALSKLDADMFPGHSYRLNALKDLSSIPSLPSNIHLLRSSLNVEVRPPREPTVDQATLDSDRFHPIATGERSLYLPDEVRKAFKKAGADAAALPRGSPRSYDGVTIVPLGTSSALPSKYRNVSSTLVQIPGHGNILLDCGEGTWGQLARAFGSDDMSAGAWQVLRDLKCIFLSHIHGDHHIGLAKVLAMRKQLNPPPKEPLYVVGIRSLHLYLHELSDLEDLGLNDPITGVVLLLSDSLNFRGPNIARYGRWQLKDEEDWMDNERSVALNKDLCALLGLSAFTTVDVDHRTRCYGLVLDHNEKWRLVFSGDTKPTQNLVQAGKNATVLIHEATMGDDQEELAAQKAHSTVGQAISIGTDMKASNIMLTHFSARYPKMPPAIVNKSDSKTNVVLAFDHARVRFGDMMKLRTYLPALEAFYGEVAVDDDDNDEGITTLLVESNVPDA
ncbi:hypothetical protein EUX98_g1639 [Antrodiella citrinella]|uniref:ribonuclease Z n=1 Tax=Antrodiella citrinella TaxID=2447956 RepID=A0A4V6S1X9_9APHY|nr:hypothetical protein EUX98_g1639 [Antrodiella citrinella]